MKTYQLEIIRDDYDSPENRENITVENVSVLGALDAGFLICRIKIGMHYKWKAQFPSMYDNVSECEGEIYITVDEEHKPVFYVSAVEIKEG